MAARSIREHYDTLLADHYTWMFGGTFEEKVSEQRGLLERFGISAQESGATITAIDLGCGSGFQSMALAEIGFRPVLAVDTAAKLLDELKSRSAGRAIQTACADLCEAVRLAEPGGAAVIVCMGDTLTHLGAKKDVSNLFRDAQSALMPGGRIVLTFRDLTTEANGLDRFVPVRSDEDKIMTCFLEYVSAGTLIVHDLIHVRTESGWTLYKGSYPKLRLAPDWVCAELCAEGFTVLRSEQAGRLWAITAVKAP